MKNATVSLFYTFVRMTLVGECLCLEKLGTAFPVIQRYAPSERNPLITLLQKNQTSIELHIC
jgi:hypothetical protein